MILNSYNIRLQSIACALILAFGLELLMPLSLAALTSGPAQPEFTSFEPVATTGMVNEFTGSFTYNLPVIQVPGANGGGYAMSLSYHSGAASAEDASWVGYGWSLNPGAIVRSKQGFPDEYRDTEVKYYNRTPENKTYAIGYYAGLEAFSDLNPRILEKAGLKFGFQSMIRYNNYQGYSNVQGLSFDVFNLASLNFNVDEGEVSFEASVNPAALVNWGSEAFFWGMEGKLSRDNIFWLASHRIREFSANSMGADAINYLARNYGFHPRSPLKLPSNTAAQIGRSYNVHLGLTTSVLPFIPGALGIGGGLTGNYTWQRGVAVEPKKAYGYMYAGDISNKDAIMDYFTEKEMPYTLKSRYIGLPYASPDYFGMTGEGLNGGFRLHNRGFGTFRPNARTSRIEKYDISLKGIVGTDFGGGAQISSGQQKMTVGQWHGPYDTAYRFLAQDDTAAANDGEAWFFRFTGDMGGAVEFAADDKALRAEVESGLPALPWQEMYGSMNQGQRSGRSSYIAWRSNAEMIQQLNDVHYKAYTRQPAVLHDYVDRSDPNIADGIGEIAVYGEGGARYSFGLPVYNRNERDMHFYLPGGYGQEYNNLAYRRLHEDSNSNVAGQFRAAPYAGTYLMTDITSPDYIDRTGDGPSADDFGGYTAFRYRRTAGTWNKSVSGADSARAWYKWRSPYRGMHLDMGRLIDGQDDRGSVASGEKEVYYLKAVETKTHVAYFITNKTSEKIVRATGDTLHLQGSGDERLDAYESYRRAATEYENEARSLAGYVPDDYIGIWNDSLAGKRFNNTWLDSTEVGSVTPNKVEYLERIELYARDETGRPRTLLKTVRFEYDYSLAYSQPVPAYWEPRDSNGVIIDTIYHFAGFLNSACGFTPQNVLPVHAGNQVAMYRMGKLTLKRVWTEYEGVVNAKISPYHFEYAYKRENQGDYAPEIVARYQSVTKAMNHIGGADYENPPYSEQHNDRWGWYNPAGIYRNSAMNPYTDQNPHIWYDPAPWHLKAIRLPSGGEIHVQYERHDYAYVQDRPAMAMVSLASIATIPVGASTEKRYYLKAEEDLGVGKNLTGAAKIAALEELRQKIHRQFVSDKEKIYFRFLYQFQHCGNSLDTESFPGGANDYISAYINVDKVGIDTTYADTLLYITIKGHKLPREIAEEYARVHKFGKLDCNSPNEGLGDENHKSEDFWRSLAEMLPGLPYLKAANAALFGPTAKPYLHHSYFRVPLSRPKLGGGARVKRLLMYDEGLEAGDAVLYGTEYIYKTTDADGRAISSGVATNEPGRGREENTLVRPIISPDEAYWKPRTMAGRYIEELEGPLGEAMLPAPAIGYSRVLTRNIHSGKTSPGFAVSEFYTARDYPLQVRNTTTDKKERSPNPIGDFFGGISSSAVWLSQGYSIIRSDMHGRPKTIRSYSGSYESFGDAREIRSQEFTYFEPGEKVPMFTGPAQPLSYAWPGKEMEIMMESRKVRDLGEDYRLWFDVGVTAPSAFAIPVGFGHAAFKLSVNDVSMHTHVINKVVSYPAILKSVRTQAEGIRHTEEYLAFDPATGQPAISMSSDGHDALALEQSPGGHKGAYTNYRLPAWQQYPALGQKARNERLVIRTSGYLDTYNNLFYTPGRELHAGDMLELIHPAGPTTVCCHITDKVMDGWVKVQPLSWSSWPSTSDSVRIEVLQSGRANRLGATAGALTLYGRSRSQVLAESNLAGLSTNVIGAAATMYSDDWDYNEALYGAVPAGIHTPTDYESGRRGRWRSWRSYVYRSTVQGGVNDPERNYADAGVYSSFSFFTWDTATAAAQWLALNTVTAVSPHGEILEERNILGVPSAAQFSHKNMLPAIVAANAEQGAIRFESFEDGKGTAQGIAHSGMYSKGLTPGWQHVDTLVAGERMKAAGLCIRFWTKGGPALPCSLKVGSLAAQAPALIAQTGEWKLFEAIVPPGAISAAAGTLLPVQFLRNGGTAVYLDDLRIQPLDAAAACYVYDRATLRLLCSFDDAHFGLYYQYSAEGRLMRRMKETERGLKTVQESQYHLPETARPLSDGGASQTHIEGLHAYRPDRRLRDAAVRGLHPGGLESATGGKNDILDFRLGPDGPDLRLFGRDSLPGRNAVKDTSGRP